MSIILHKFYFFKIKNNPLLIDLLMIDVEFNKENHTVKNYKFI